MCFVSLVPFLFYSLLCVHFSFTTVHEIVLPYSPYWILATDYVNSAVVYSCTDVLRLFHVDFAWILSRTRTLPDSTIEEAQEIFTQNNIDVIRMSVTKQQGCDKTTWVTKHQWRFNTRWCCCWWRILREVMNNLQILNNLSLIFTISDCGK